MSRKSSRLPTHDPIRAHLMAAIRSGQYAAGDRLPTERALAEQLGMPRSAVRDVLAVLEGESRIVRIVGSGTYVAQLGGDAPADAPLAAPAGVLGPDSSPKEIMEARLLIEPGLAEFVAMNATASDFDRLEECNRHAEHADSPAIFEQWDAALHQTIALATHNRLIISLYEAITRARDQTEWGDLKLRNLTPERRQRYLEDHRAIVAALRARQAEEATGHILRHLQSIRANLLGF